MRSSVEGPTGVTMKRIASPNKESRNHLPPIISKSPKIVTSPLTSLRFNTSNVFGDIEVTDGRILDKVADLLAIQNTHKRLLKKSRDELSQARKDAKKKDHVIQKLMHDKDNVERTNVQLKEKMCNLQLLLESQTKELRRIRKENESMKRDLSFSRQNPWTNPFSFSNKS